jgi:hypothetical protein
MDAIPIDGKERESMNEFEIAIKYTCKECGLTEQELIVPERQRAVDVVY